MPRALVRRPSPRLAEGLLTHIARVPVDVDLATRQWEGYVAALAAEGWETVEVPPADDCPDAAFVEDTVVVYADLAVISRPGADERRPETAGTEEALAALGYRIERIREPGTLDGGDVLKHGGMGASFGSRPSRASSSALPGKAEEGGGTASRRLTTTQPGDVMGGAQQAMGPKDAPKVWVGLGGRTNRSGMEQLAALLDPARGDRGRRTREPGAAPEVRRDRAAGRHRRRLRAARGRPGDVGAVPAGPRGGGVARRAARRRDRADVDQRAPHPGAVRVAGLRVVATDISEFEKLEGCVTCLSVRLR